MAPFWIPYASCYQSNRLTVELHHFFLKAYNEADSGWVSASFELFRLVSITLTLVYLNTLNLLLLHPWGHTYSCCLPLRQHDVFLNHQLDHKFSALRQLA